MCKFRDMLNWRIQRPRQRPATHCRSEPKNADQSMFKVDLSTDWNSMAAGAIRRKTGTIDMEWQLFYICLDGQFVACYFFDPSEAWNKFQLKLFRMSGWHATNHQSPLGVLTDLSVTCSALTKSGESDKMAHSVSESLGLQTHLQTLKGSQSMVWSLGAAGCG